MKKLVVFGDSFANYDWVQDETSHLSWATILSLNLNLPLINYGVSGSGLNYSMSRFLDYVYSENYDSSDIIIWVTSHEHRLYTTTMHHPHLGSFYNFPPKKLSNMFGKDRQWIDENEKHALWAIDNYYDPTINYSLLKIVSFFKQWARSNKNATVILLKGQHYLKGGEKIHSFLDHITEHDNFFPILKQENSLDVISFNEFIDVKLQQYMLSKNGSRPGVDRRVNHLSEINRLILAKQLTNIITHRSSEHWDGSEYKKHIYCTKQDINNTTANFC